MFQCLGLATEQDGGCGEDWWHPECVLGLGRDWLKKEDVDAEGYGESLTPLPPGFPQEEEFEVFVCYKCVEANPWIKGYAGTEGFLRPVFKKDSALGADLPEIDHITSAQASGDLDEASSHVKPPTVNGESTILENVSKSEPTMQSPSTVEKGPNPELSSQSPTNTENKLYSEPSAQIPTNAPSISKKRKADDDPILDPAIPYPDAKKLKPDPTPPYHESLPPAPDGIFSIFLQENFRDKFCRCSSCYPLLRIHPQLLEEEDSYEPPLSQNGQEGGGESVGTGSLLDMGEAALSNVDRVRAIGEFLDSSFPSLFVSILCSYRPRSHTFPFKNFIFIRLGEADKQGLVPRVSQRVSWRTIISRTRSRVSCSRLLKAELP